MHYKVVIEVINVFFKARISYISKLLFSYIIIQVNKPGLFDVYRSIYNTDSRFITLIYFKRTGLIILLRRNDTVKFYTNLLSIKVTLLPAVFNFLLSLEAYALVLMKIT